MNRRVQSLPLRIWAEMRQQQAAWTCRRCLATQTTDGSINSFATHSTAPSLEGQNIRPQASQIKTLSPSTNEQSDWSHLKFLGKQLPHPIPPQYLQHCNKDVLTPEERKERAKIPPGKHIRGVVVSAGKMDKTVKIRVAGRLWNKRIGKFYDHFTTYLVHDPNSSLIAGDVVDVHKLRVSSTVRHVVSAIVSPFEKSIEERPPIPTPEERLDTYKQFRFEKLARRDLRRRAAQGETEAIDQLKAFEAPGKPASNSAKRSEPRPKKS